MNLFSDYQKKIFNSLKNLEKKNKIRIPPSLESFAVEWLKLIIVHQSI